MKFIEVKELVKTNKFVTLRSDSEELFEAVLVKEELKQLNACLSKIFGQPFFPPEKNIYLANKIVENYGGIAAGQTFYYLEDDLIVAMLWPWQDGVNITFKLISKKD